MKKFVNIITLIRLLSTVILPFVWANCNPKFIFIFIVIMLLSDFVDGKLARMFKVQTLFGSILDTVADKMFGIVIIIIVATYHHSYLVLIIMEALIAVANIIAAFLGAVTKSSFIGKFKMWLIGAAIVIGMISIFKVELFNGVTNDVIKSGVRFFLHNENYFIYTSVFITFGAQIIVLVDYIYRFVKDLKVNKINKNKINFKSNEELKHVLFDTDYYLNNKTKSLKQHLLVG